MKGETGDTAIPPEETYATAVCGRIFLAAHINGLAAPVIDEIRRGLTTLARTYPTGIGLVLLLKRPAKPPEGAVRQPLVETMKELKQQLKAFAVVVEGDGFWASAVRSTLSFLSMAGSYPVKVFATLEEAIVWEAAEVTRLSGAVVDAAELMRAAAKLR